MPEIDKQAHFWAGMAIFFALNTFIVPLHAIFATVAIGGAKEAWDHTGKGTPEFMDFVWTAIGGFVGLGIHFIPYFLYIA